MTDIYVYFMSGRCDGYYINFEAFFSGPITNLKEIQDASEGKLRELKALHPLIFANAKSVVVLNYQFLGVRIVEQEDVKKSLPGIDSKNW